MGDDPSVLLNRLVKALNNESFAESGSEPMA
jgi:hypothetical protein